MIIVLCTCNLQLPMVLSFEWTQFEVGVCERVWSSTIFRIFEVLPILRNVYVLISPR